MVAAFEREDALDYLQTDIQEPDITGSDAGMAARRRRGRGAVGRDARRGRGGHQDRGLRGRTPRIDGELASGLTAS